MEYEVKKKQESGWVAITGTTMTLVTALFIWGGAPMEVSIPAGAFIGALIRPVGGYLISFLPQPKKPVS